MSTRTIRQSGFTLIEMVMAIVIIGIGLAGVLTVFNIAVKSSADPLIRKQLLAVAEEMLEEVLLKPYAVTGTAPVNSLKVCGASASREAFDDVSDYDAYQTTGICDIDGIAVTGLETYNLAIVVASGSLGSLATNVKKITVTVTHGGESMVLVGWRTDYAS